MKKSKTNSFIRTWAPPIIVIVILLAVLQTASNIMHASETGLFPVPSYIWKKGVELMTTTPVDYVSTISHMLIGYAVSIPVAFVIASLLAQSKVVIKATSTLVLLIATMPMVVLIPILFIWTKYAPYTRTLAVVITVTPIILLNVLSGFTTVSPDKEALAKVYGMNKRERFFKVVIPQAMPRIFVGLRLGVINSTLGAVSSELTGGGGDKGLGYRVSVACMYNDVQKAYACIILLAATAYILSTVVTSIENRVNERYFNR